MQDRPNAAELTVAVAEFLEREILPTLTDARLKFRTLVTLNGLGMLARELQLEELHLHTERERLLRLLNADEDAPPTLAELKAQVMMLNVELAGYIRRGDFPKGTLEHIEATLRDKLAVVNPRFKP